MSTARCTRSRFVLVAGALISAAIVLPQRAFSQSDPSPPDVTDQQIGEAIRRGGDFILQHFVDGELELDDCPKHWRQGLDALCVYALASSGKAIDDPRLGSKSPEMIAMIDRLKNFTPASDGRLPPLVYTRALRACALAAINRPQDRTALEDDADWLINAAANGGYSYSDEFSPNRDRKPLRRRPATRSSVDQHNPASIVLVADPPRRSPPRVASESDRAVRPSKFLTDFPWDNSNSQYGLLGAWAAAEAGVEIPADYWRDVDRHWKLSQLADGQWYYSLNDRNPRFSMTCAGVASLLVTHDYLDTPTRGTQITPQPYSRQLQAGLAWLEAGDNALDLEHGGAFYLGYNLFGLERVALASGLKYMGENNWFVELTRYALRHQQPSGSFNFAARDPAADDDSTSTLIDTAYTLLFLSRGRHPILVNKLRFEGFWTNRPREIANLAGYVSRELERPVNWQVVDLARDPSDWADAPILYIASHKPLNFDDAAVDKLRAFVQSGGLLFTHADTSAEPFNQSVAELVKRLFPGLELVDLPVDHALYNLNYVIPLPKPRLQGVSNGSRLLLLHSPADFSNAWQTRSTVNRKTVFQLGANIYLYATGKERFRNRLDTPIILDPPDAPRRTVLLARLKYDGSVGANWDPEPAAWPRMGRLLQWETGTKLDIRPIELAELKFDPVRLAHLTGTDALKPTAQQVAAMKSFVEAGGALLIDAAGGSGAFAEAESGWLAQLIAPARLQTLPPEDALVKQTIRGTTDVPSRRLRLFALEELRNDSPRIKSARLGKGTIIFSALDIHSGLLGTNTWGILGYLPEFSEAFARNWIVTSPR